MFKLSNPFKAKAIESYIEVRKFGKTQAGRRDALVVIEYDETGGRTAMIVLKDGNAALGHSPKAGISLRTEHYKAGSEDARNIIREVKSVLLEQKMPVTAMLQIEPLLK